MSRPRLDAVVFAGVIGENAACVRASVPARHAVLGLDADADINDRTPGWVACIVGRSRAPAALAAPTDEERMIACDIAAIALGNDPVAVAIYKEA